MEECAQRVAARFADITPRIIAMAFPSEGAEQLYRNPMVHVVKFLDENHWDKYMVFNL